MRDDVKVATIPERIRRNAEATHQAAGHRLARTHQVDDMMRDDVKVKTEARTDGSTQYRRRFPRRSQQGWANGGSTRGGEAF